MSIVKKGIEWFNSHIQPKFVKLLFNEVIIPEVGAPMKNKKPCPYCGGIESVKIKIYPNKDTLEIEQNSLIDGGRNAAIFLFDFL